MKLAFAGLLFFLCSTSFSQVPSIELSSSPTCIGDTVAISYKVSNVQTITWSTSGDGLFLERKTTVTSSTGYVHYIPLGGDLLDGPFLIAAAASSADQTIIRTHATKVQPLPRASFERDSVIYPNTEASFRNFSDIPSGSVNSYTLDYGDGAIDTFDGSFKSTDHYYNRPGDFEVTLCATSDAGCEDCTTKSLKSAWRMGVDESIPTQDFVVAYENHALSIQHLGSQTFEVHVYTLDGREQFSAQGLSSYAFVPNSTGVYLCKVLTQAGPVSFKYFIPSL